MTMMIMMMMDDTLVLLLLLGCLLEEAPHDAGGDEHAAHHGLPEDHHRAPLHHLAGVHCASYGYDVRPSVQCVLSVRWSAFLSSVKINRHGEGDTETGSSGTPRLS